MGKDLGLDVTELLGDDDVDDAFASDPESDVEADTRTGPAASGATGPATSGVESVPTSAEPLGAVAPNARDGSAPDSADLADVAAPKSEVVPGGRPVDAGTVGSPVGVLPSSYGVSGGVHTPLSTPSATSRGFGAKSSGFGRSFRVDAGPSAGADGGLGSPGVVGVALGPEVDRLRAEIARLENGERLLEEKIHKLEHEASIAAEGRRTLLNSSKQSLVS